MPKRKPVIAGPDDAQVMARMGVAFLRGHGIGEAHDQELLNIIIHAYALGRLDRAHTRIPACFVPRKEIIH